jgi:hypothetical protein
MNTENIRNMEFEQIRNEVYAALRQLYEKDIVLFDNAVGEWSISAYLFFYLKTSKKLERYCIDVEYNKMTKGNVFNGQQLKKRMENGSNVRPDIIIHQRKPNTNLLWIEMKLFHSKESLNDDIEKLKSVVREYEKDVEYVTGYHFGLSIVLGKCGGCCTWILANRDKGAIHERFYVGNDGNIKIIENTKQRCSECEFEDCRLVKIKEDNNLD